MNMKEVIAAGLHFVSCLSPLKGQPTICHVRLIFSLLFICVLPQHAMGPDSGRLGFICHPKINDFHKQLCFSHYSAEMSPLMGPYFFVLVTACALFVLWTTMIQYSYLHLQKSRRVKLLSEKECLCHGFWNMILFHLGSEAVVLSVILGIFCYTQKIYFPETYNCTVMIATVITCRDQHHWVKSIFNILFIGGMASILLLCIATVCQAVCNKEKFIKELLVLSNTVYAADDDCNHHSDTSRNNANDRSSEFTNNHKERTKYCQMMMMQFASTTEIYRAKVNRKVNMFDGLVDLLKILKLVAQPLAGSVRLLLTVVIFYVSTSRDTGRLSVSDFTCHPENNDWSTEECFSTYSAEMSSFMHPQFFVIITAVVLFFFWSVMILYSYRQIEKIRRTSVTAITKLKNEFWGKVLLHVRCEAVFIIVSLGLFCCTQKIHVAETYDCIPRNAPMKILTCRDKHQQDKKDLNIYFLGGMISILLCCMWEICRAKKCEVYFKELVDFIVTKSEAGYDGNQRGETPMLGSDVGSGSFAPASLQSGDERQVKRRKVEVKRDDDGKHHRNTQSGIEKRVGRVPDDIFQVIVNDFTIRENFLESLVFPLRYLLPSTFPIGLSEWIEDICSVMNSGELEERDKILDVLEQLPLREALYQWITERAVMHRKRNTDIAQDRDESFQVSVSRRIVAIVDKWMEEIFSVMNSGELGERDKILDVLKQLSVSKVLDQWITERAVIHRKRNTDIAQDRDEIFQVSVSRRIVAIVVKWVDEMFSVMISGELEERDKIVDLFDRLSELRDPWNTKRAVMHRKRNTDIAKDCDDSFPVSVSRRIVAIVARWLRQILMLINREGVEERDKILDMLEQWPLSEVLHQRITEGGYRL